MEHWRTLRNRFGLKEDDLSLWDVRLPGCRMIRCDPRIWMAHLYYETVYSKYRKNEEILWPRGLAYWHLKQKFSEYHHPTYKDDPAMCLDLPLCGFAQYLHELGILTPDTPDRYGNRFRIDHILTRLFPVSEVVDSVKAKMEREERDGFAKWAYEQACKRMRGVRDM